MHNNSGEALIFQQIFKDNPNPNGLKDVIAETTKGI